MRGKGFRSSNSDTRETPMAKSDDPDDGFPWTTKEGTALPQAQSCRLIDFEKVDIVPGIAKDTWFVIVGGTKPYRNMSVDLRPLIYVRQPAYWGIEVVGCLPGIGLPAEAPYSESIPLDGIRGTKGIEILGATKSEKREVPPN